MAGYICHHCGQRVDLYAPPKKERKCPNCGSKLRVCNNCRYFDAIGCVLRDCQPFTASHGATCTRFEFHLAAA